MMRGAASLLPMLLWTIQGLSIPTKVRSGI